MRLNEIASAAILTGVDPDGAADVIAVRWMDSRVVAVAGAIRPDQVQFTEALG